MQTLTIGAYRATLAPTRDVGAFQAKLAKCNGKSRRLPLRDLRTKAGFPVFEPGMSTAEYVRLYSSGDGSQLKAWEWAQLNDAPCTLYSGEDTCETLPDGFETWEDFDAAQSADAAPESTLAAANDDAAPTVPDPEPAARAVEVIPFGTREAFDAATKAAAETLLRLTMGEAHDSARSALIERGRYGAIGARGAIVDELKRLSAAKHWHGWREAQKALYTLGAAESAPVAAPGAIVAADSGMLSDRESAEFDRVAAESMARTMLDRFGVSDPAACAHIPGAAAEIARIEAAGIVAGFYRDFANCNDGAEPGVDAILQRAQHLRGTAAGFADLPNPDRGAPYAEAARMLESDAQSKPAAQSEPERIADETAAPVDPLPTQSDSVPVPGKLDAAQTARTAKILDRLIRSDGALMTRRAFVELKVADGLRPTCELQDKIKPMTRMQVFRATNEQQRAHDARVKAGGKREVFYLGGFEVTKAEHDYAAQIVAALQAPIADPVPSKSEPAAHGEDVAAPVPDLEAISAAPIRCANNDAAPAWSAAVNGAVRRGLDRTPIQNLPNYARMAIERADADSGLRSTAKVSELVRAYAATHGAIAEEWEIASALYICGRRFWDFDAAPDGDGPTASPPATHSEPAPARPVYASDHLAWLDVENGRAEPDEYQARVIECFGEVKAGGLFYNSDTYPATAALMTARYGYPDWRGDRGQSDGVANPFGMDCYRANSVIRARAERERERGAAATFTVGQRFARLIFSDGKQRTAAELVTLDPAGFACKLKAKSGRNSVEITCSAYALSLAVIRAEERGKVLAAKRARARPEPIALEPAEPAPVPSKSEREDSMLQHVLGALQRIAPDGIPDSAMLAREADRIEATAERMRDAMPDYSATCATVARDLRTLADPALDDDETIPAPLDGLDVAELDDMAEFERAGGIAQPIAPAYRDDAPRATPTPSLRISPSDPRARIPARFAPVYLLQA